MKRETTALKRKNHPLFRRRSSIQIITEILEAAKNPMTITGLIYKARSHYTPITKYLNKLLSSKLIESISEENGKTRYRITKKGEEFLSVMRELEEIISSTAKGNRKH